MEKRSPVEVMEGTHEEATEVLHAGTESCHPKGHLLEQVPISELCDKQGLQPRSSTAGRRSSSRTARPPFSRKRWRATTSTTTTSALNSAIGYITPKDMLAGRQQEIHADRDRKLEAARQQRQIRRQSAA